MERRGIMRLGAFGYAVLVCIAASQLIYADGWSNGLVSDDWRILYKASDLGGGSLRSILSPTTSWFYRPVELLLTRALARRAELAVRTALGASGRSIAANFLAEGAVLAALSLRLDERVEDLVPKRVELWK